jgi:hypothetical protein
MDSLVQTRTEGTNEYDLSEKFLDATNNCPGCGNTSETPLDDEVEW